MIKTGYDKTIRLLRLMMLVVVFAPLSLWAQNTTVSGMVTDNNNEPAIGASVAVKNSTIGAVTDLDGKYSINAPSNATLVITYLGYTAKEEKVNGRAQINVVLQPDDNMLDDVVVVGYGVQKKVTLTGAVSGLKGSEMLTTRTENPQNMLTGKIAGVRVWQKSSEPGSYSANFDIRGLGAPLVVIDGIPRTTEDFQRMNPNDIEDMSVLKDASAAIYGVRAANGVVLVTTKKGTKEGKTTVSYNGSFTMQRPSGMPKLANVYDAMTVLNEGSMRKVDGSGSRVYPDDVFEAYRNGSRRTADWNSLVFADSAPQSQHDLSITGGNAKTQYYVGMGYFYQEGFFKSGDLNYDKYNLRSNITTEIMKGLTLNLNLSGVMDQQNNPYSGTSDIIRSYWGQGVLWPAYADPEGTMLNYQGLDKQENTVAKMTSDVSGYRKYATRYFQSSGTLNYDLGTISPTLKGLSAKALFSYDYKQSDNKIFRKEYSQYALVDGKYMQNLYAPSSPSRDRREMFGKSQMLGQFIMNYDRTFNTVHKVNGLLGWETSSRSGDNFYAQRNLAFATDDLTAGVATGEMGGMSSNQNDYYDINTQALIGRVNYAYADRYLAEMQFRYDASSKFSKGNQWGFFPSASVGWRVSEEPFFKSTTALSFVNQLKLRASYGTLGDDGDFQYDWVTGYLYPATNDNGSAGYYNQYAPGYMIDGKYVSSAASLALPNNNVTWFTSKTFDAGVDFEGWNGLFGFSFDYFDRRREGLFARSSEIPTEVGAKAPRENVNSDRQYGMDLELTHRNKINDFLYKVKGIATITRNEYRTAVQNGPYANSYNQWRKDNLNNRYQGVQFGYTSAGRYQNWDDIWYYPIQKGKDVLPGDYKYEDWNGDGEINDQDEHPYAYDQTPYLNYSMSFDGSYKNFDLNILFQGSALGSMKYEEPLYTVWGLGVLDQFLDRWHPVDPSADPWNTSTQWVSGYYGYARSAEGNSEFNRVSTAYLRLKSIELGYTLPKMKALAMMNLRIFANAYNLFTITGVNFVDPEHPDTDLGRMYPLNRTYTVGLSLSF